MIKLTRPKRPEPITEHRIAWTKIYLDAVSSGDKEEIKKAEGKYRHKDIKASLQSMHNKKCAFCESLIEHVSYSHIEHFKPKSVFRKKIFQWNNLFLACGVCNGAGYKGEKFPTALEHGPLINPALENPGDFLEFRFDPTTKAAVVVYKNARGKTTIDTLGLNRIDLSTIRSQVVKKLFVLRQIHDRIDVPLDVRQKAADIIRDAASSNQHYSAFAKALAP